MIINRIRAGVTGAMAVCAMAAGTAVAAPAPLPVQREVISITRTATTGQAALALVGRIDAKAVPGFFAQVDAYRDGKSLSARLVSILDIGSTNGLERYGHGSSQPLCGVSVVCSIDRATGVFTFSLTITDDSDDKGSDWLGRTRFLVLEGSGIKVTSAAVGFTVTRHADNRFRRISREQADSDGVGAYGTGLEMFRSAAAPGGAGGSIAVVQLPCDLSGAGGVTFSATGDAVPSVVACGAEPGPTGVYAGGSGAGVSGGGTQGLFTRVTSRRVDWQLSGAVSGVSGTVTRLFVLDL